MSRLDLIIDALELAWKENNNEKFYDKYIYALAAARELKALAQPEQEPVAYVEKGDLYWCDDTSVYDAEKLNGHGLYAAPPRKPWQGLTSEDWENTPDTGKQGCERDVEMFDWIEQTLKDKNDTF